MGKREIEIINSSSGTQAKRQSEEDYKISIFKVIKENEKKEDITKKKLLEVKNVVFKMKNLRLNIRLNILQRELVNWMTDLRKSYKCSAKYKETENM